VHAVWRLFRCEPLKKKGFQIPPPIGDQVDDHCVFKNPVDNPVRLEEDLAIFGRHAGWQFLWSRAAMGKLRYTLRRLQQTIQDMIRAFWRIMVGDPIDDALQIAPRRKRNVSSVAHDPVVSEIVEALVFPASRVRSLSTTSSNG